VIVPKTIADNPGEWMLHCHNAYHADAGMLPGWTTTVDAHGAGRQP
jgi:FtsP/CotA-like multicopper oxidase with cupredoxin domain